MRIFGMDTPELLLIGLVGVLLFGTKKLPELARSLGQTVRELKKGVKEGFSEEGAVPEVTEKK
ncbi:MAG: twin-arginine translocase TatA/TatE family subunit [Elusimicrobiota bacterium]|nr:twin-arginine translocase TatA/TatE family subunit [Elusimicrobiota bacterium]